MAHRKFSQISRAEWIAFKWVSVKTHDSFELLYINAGMREVDEAKEAADNYDTMKAAIEELAKEQNEQSSTTS